MLVPADQERLASALAHAARWHGAQTRKGTAVPYVAHLLQVAGAVLEHGGDADQAVAALLHDVVEDTEAGVADIEQAFGARVAEIVTHCTDTFDDDTPRTKSPWLDRKERWLARLESVPPDAALVIACDKRHNLASLLADIELLGRASVSPPRFTSTPEQQLWYHDEAVARLQGRIPERLAGELVSLVERYRAAVEAS